LSELVQLAERFDLLAPGAQVPHVPWVKPIGVYAVRAETL
jgi:hypothetical protein